MSKIPIDASPSVQDAFRQLHARLDQVIGSKNVDLRGRRLINAGGAQGPSDYITKADLEARLARTTTTTTTPPVATDTTPTTPAGSTPSAPTNLQVTIGTNPNTYSLTWDPAPVGETVLNYLIGLGTSPGANDVLYSGLGVATSYSGSANGATYLYIHIYASGDVNGNLLSPQSNEVIANWGGAPPPPPGGGGGGGSTSGANLNLSIGQPAGVPGPSLLWFRGNMCGVHVPGIGAVGGGAADSTLVLSWLWPQYGASDRAAILAAHTARGYTHFLMSWPDSRDRDGGMNAATFVSRCQEVASAGMYPVVFLCSKDFDPASAGSIISNWAGDGILGALAGGGFTWIACVGWELSLFLSPADVQTLIDSLSGSLPGIPLFVHFQEDYISFQLDGLSTADFWNTNQGKLTGLLHQKALAHDANLYQLRIDDGLTRFAGNFNFHWTPVYVACEITAAYQFNGSLSEAGGDAMGFVAICAPAQSGPLGTVAVSGFLNGCITPGGTRV